MDIFREYIFLTPVIVMIISEITKHLFEGVYHNVWFAHGGMPSSHSAFVTSLMIVVARHDGLASTTFAISCVFAGIVWYDAAFVRSNVGKQAKALNALQQLQIFSERIGHSILEVCGGIMFGGLLTGAIIGYLY